MVQSEEESTEGWPQGMSNREPSLVNEAAAGKPEPETFTLHLQATPRPGCSPARRIAQLLKIAKRRFRLANVTMAVEMERAQAAAGDARRASALDVPARTEIQRSADTQQPCSNRKKPAKDVPRFLVCAGTPVAVRQIKSTEWTSFTTTEDAGFAKFERTERQNGVTFYEFRRGTWLLLCHKKFIIFRDRNYKRGT